MGILVEGDDCIVCFEVVVAGRGRRANCGTAVIVGRRTLSCTASTPIP